MEIELGGFIDLTSLTTDHFFALDIGGSLVKLVYFFSSSQKQLHCFKDETDKEKAYNFCEKEEIRDQLRFVKFETKLMESCIEFIKEYLITQKKLKINKKVKITGGGAFKYENLLSEKLGLTIEKEDEISCLIKGANFLLNHISDEAFCYKKLENNDFQLVKLNPSPFYPYILVNIGSGVSFVKVNSETEFERVGGSSLGGGTFWGLGSLLSKAKTFEELLNLAKSGNHEAVDMLVGDIYGGSYDALGLPANLIASSFGKAARSAKEEKCVKFKESDIAKSLLLTICNDIGHIACLNARLNNLERIVFGGFFIRNHPTTIQTISHSIQYWSKGKIKPIFLRHEGYLCAMGAFLKGVEQEKETDLIYFPPEKWGESFATSSGFDFLELIRYSRPLVSCSLLKDVSRYTPDTVDLGEDFSARKYWINKLKDALDEYTEKAIDSQANKMDAEGRASLFKENYLARLEQLKTDPLCHGPLTVRKLLETREQFLRQFHFTDLYSLKKQEENQKALKLYEKRISYIDCFHGKKKWAELINGILAGNVFDWGASDMSNLLEDDSFSFDSALSKVPPHPWLVDDLEAWVSRVEAGPPFKCVAIFVDNSGFDIILGIFPFVRELLQNNSKVILCANSGPTINDVTYNELNLLTKKLSSSCPVIRSSLENNTLFISETGQWSPCLDLRNIDEDLNDKFIKEEVDLVVLEGMGRSVHTNLEAEFKCESIKLSIIKNKWLAQRLNGKMFDIIFKYENFIDDKLEEKFKKEKDFNHMG